MQVYFRSDKANMQPEEIAAKQQQASQLQDELKKQIEDKKRVKVFHMPSCHIRGHSFILCGICSALTILMSALVQAIIATMLQ